MSKPITSSPFAVEVFMNFSPNLSLLRLWYLYILWVILILTIRDCFPNSAQIWLCILEHFPLLAHLPGKSIPFNKILWFQNQFLSLFLYRFWILAYSFLFLLFLEFWLWYKSLTSGFCRWALSRNDNGFNSTPSRICSSLSWCTFFHLWLVLSVLNILQTYNIHRIISFFEKPLPSAPFFLPLISGDIFYP